MNLLFCIAQKYGIAVVITNQVNSSHPYGKSNSTGGNVVTYASNYRVYLRRYPTDRIVASIVKSPYHFEDKTSLTLGEKGIIAFQICHIQKLGVIACRISSLKRDMDSILSYIRP